MLGDEKLEPHPSPPMPKGKFSAILVFGVFFGFFYILHYFFNFFCSPLNLILTKYFMVD
jgi:hypothetical protein